MLIVVVQYHKVVTAGVERRLQELKVDRGHLGTDNGVILTHFFGERHLYDSGRMQGSFLILLFPYL